MPKIARPAVSIERFHAAPRQLPTVIFVPSPTIAEGSINAATPESKLRAAPEPAGASARPWLGFVALALLTFASCWFAFRLTRFEGVTSLWVVNGLLTGALLLTPKK